jgi:hypothetical protein
MSDELRPRRGLEVDPHFDVLRIPETWKSPPRSLSLELLNLEHLNRRKELNPSIKTQGRRLERFEPGTL